MFYTHKESRFLDPKNHMSILSTKNTVSSCPSVNLFVKNYRLFLPVRQSFCLNILAPLASLFDTKYGLLLPVFLIKNTGSSCLSFC